MAHFLYISDVFCPWCYGFSKNIAKIKKKFALPFEVYAGALVEPAVDLEARVKQSPNVQAFIDKLYAATGVKISDDYMNMLFSGNAKNIFMDSKKASRLFYVLKHFKPEFALEIMEFLQFRFYNLGKDIFAEDTVHSFAETFAVSSVNIFKYLHDEQSEIASHEETEKGFDILGEIVLYPTLYYVENGVNHFISRGYVNYEDCEKAIFAAMRATENNQDGQSAVLMGKSCSLDGTCG